MTRSNTFSVSAKTFSFFFPPWIFDWSLIDDRLKLFLSQSKRKGKSEARMSHAQLRASHAQGPTRVCADGGHILTGGSDGKVCLFTSKRWPASAPVWTADACHSAAVTCLTLCDKLGIAFSGSRDGTVMMHQQIASATPVRRVVCRVTGEINCLLLDKERMRVFIAGDSVRFVALRPTVTVTSIPLHVPGPIFSLALSPCGEVLAMASAAGSVGIASLVNDPKPGQTQTQTDGGETQPDAAAAAASAAKIRNLRFVVSKIVSVSRRKDDMSAFRMCWTLSLAGDLLLAVPAADGIRVLKLIPAIGTDGASPQHRLSVAGTVQIEGLIEPSAVAMFPNTKHKLSIVAASSLPGATKIFVAKVDDAKWRSELYAVHTCSNADPKNDESTTQSSLDDGIVDLQVDVANGNICFALQSGRVGLVRGATPGVVNAAKKAAAAEMTQQQQAVVELPETQMSAPPTTESKTKVKDGKENVALPRDADNEPSEGSDDATNSDDSASADEDGDEDEEDDDDEDQDEDEGEGDTSAMRVVKGAAPENMKEVVTDLIRSNPDFISQDGLRRKGLEDALQRHKQREGKSSRGTTFALPSFVDEEAEESSAGSNDNDEEEDRLEEDEREDGIPAPEREEESLGRASSGVHDGPSRGGPRVMTEVEPLYTVQPGMTAPADDGSRYFAFNNIGCIRLGAEGDLSCFFHDIARPSIRITEKGEPILAALGMFGAAILFRPDDVEGCYSLFYRIFQGVGTQPSWRLALLKDEEPLCVAVGAMRIAVATTFYLRIFMPSGLEVAVVSLASHVVGLAAVSSVRGMAQTDPTMDPLAIAVLQGGEVVVRVVNMAQRGREVIPPTPVPLEISRQTGLRYPLQWLGFSEHGPLCAADTRGIVWQLTADYGTSWVPLHDPRHVACLTKNVWIYGICDEHIYAYVLQHDEVYPPALPAAQLPVEHCRLCCPLTVACGPKAMLQRDQTVRGYLKMAFERSRSATYTEALARLDARCDQRLFEAFVAAVKEQDLARAFDYASLFELRETLEKACNLTNGANMTFLTNKLQVLLQLRRAKKLPRQCQLPLEGDMTDRDRDAIIKKLLGELDKCQKTIAQLENKVAGWAPAVHPAQQVCSTPAKTDAQPQEQRTDDNPPPPRPRRITFEDNTLDQQSPGKMAALPPAPNASARVQAEAPLPATSKPAPPFAKKTTLAPVQAAPPRITIKSTVPAALPLSVHGATEAADASKAQSPPAAAHSAPTAPVLKGPKQPAAQVPEDDITAPPLFCDLPIDPFLSQGQDGTVAARGARMDMGHDDGGGSQAVVARSASFGDALRKRYRSEDDDDGEEPVVPVLSFAR